MYVLTFVEHESDYIIIIIKINILLKTSGLSDSRVLN